MGDSEWVKKFLAGEREHVRLMTLANISLSAPIKTDAEPQGRARSF